MVRELSGMHPLPSESIYALRQLLKNAIDAIDQRLIRDAGDAGLVAYAIQSIVSGSANVSPNDAQDIHGANQDFHNGMLLDVEEASVQPLMRELFGFRWERRSNDIRELDSIRRADGVKFIERCQRICTD